MGAAIAQDIEANIEILKTQGKVMYFLHKLLMPFMWRTKKEDWIKLLELDLKHELEEIEFEKTIEKKWSNFFK